MQRGAPFAKKKELEKKNKGGGGVGWMNFLSVAYETAQWSSAAVEQKEGQLFEADMPS